MNEKIIDVSVHNGAINFEKVKKDGVYGVIIRAGFGKSATQKDKNFETNYKKAKAAGLHVGAYWFSYALSAEEALQEANACLEVIKGKQFDLPVYFDIEEPKNQSLSKEVNTAIVRTFCEKVEYEGYFVGVYSGDYFYVNHLNYEELKNRFTIWCARWPSADKDDGKTIIKPKFATTYDIHQYSSKGNVDGISGNVDMNYLTRDFVTIIRKKELNGYNNVAWKYNMYVEIPKISSEDLYILKNYINGMGYKCKVTQKEIS